MTVVILSLSTAIIDHEFFEYRLFFFSFSALTGGLKLISAVCENRFLKGGWLNEDFSKCNFEKQMSKSLVHLDYSGTFSVVPPPLFL